jgi:hypothetical protein
MGHLLWSYFHKIHNNNNIVIEREWHINLDAYTGTLFTEATAWTPWEKMPHGQDAAEIHIAASTLYTMSMAAPHKLFCSALHSPV